MARRKQDNWSDGMAITGSTLVGLGAGLLFDQVAGGLLIGVGVGFLLMIVMNMRRNG